MQSHWHITSNNPTHLNTLKPMQHKLMGLTIKSTCRPDPLLIKTQSHFIHHPQKLPQTVKCTPCVILNSFLLMACDIILTLCPLTWHILGLINCIILNISKNKPPVVKQGVVVCGNIILFKTTKCL